MKVYNLTIVYDESGDEIEFIEETLNDAIEVYEDPLIKQLTKEIGLSEEDAIDLIHGSIEKAEA
mgnify:CR=1 FL=1|tara:strand:+ start:923 stop:1114 length:192 start_codon:yes stop_codon:yes gene_type:complete